MSHVKLFATITDSSIWDQPDHVCKIWITLLAMADWHGCVYASLPGLANRARKSIREVEEALEVFRAPDPYSRSPEHDGRRLVDIDGGWMLLNYTKHREAKNAEALRESKRLYAARARAAKKVEASRTTPSTSRINDSVVLVSDLEPDQSEGPDPEGVQGEPGPSAFEEARDRAIELQFEEAVVWDGGPVHPEDEAQEAPPSSFDAYDAPVMGAKVNALPEGWQPSESLFAEASTAGLPREYFLERIAELRLGPIGGSRGVWLNKLDDYIRKLIPKWRTWYETAKAKEPPPSSGPKSAPRSAPLPGLPAWVRSHHQELADRLQKDLRKEAKRFAREHHIPPKTLKPNDAADAFTSFLHRGPS